MNKRDFFLKAMHAGEYKRRSWVISAFSLVKEIPDAWKKEPYPYRIVQTPAGHFFIDPENAMGLTKIDEALGGMAPFSFKDRITLQPKDLPNVYETVETNLGNVIFNCTCLVFPFGDRVKFMTGRINAGSIEQEILDRTKDRPLTNGEPREAPTGPDAPLWTDEYIKFCDAMFHMAGYTQLCVPAKSEKEMVQAPGMKELRAQLIEKNKGRLHDPAVIAAIQKELIDYDKAYLKDDPAAGFLGPWAGKSYGVVRSKLFLMHGMEFGFEDATVPQLIPNSLSEGWDVEKFPAMVDSLRSGSYNRGTETMRGGEAVKWLLRASTNMNVTTDDCGTKLGLPLFVDKKSIKKLPGFSVVTPTGHEKVPDIEAAGQYLGKQILLRSPMFCKLDKTDYCAVCVGDRLSVNPTALSSAISEYGSTFMLISMGAMHGKKLETARLNYQTALF